MAVLIFPSSLEASAEYAAEARERGVRTVGASFLSQDPNAGLFDAWRHLPKIGADDFVAELTSLVADHAVEAVYTPHAPSFNFLQGVLPACLPRLKLIGEGPFKSQTAKVHAALETANACMDALQRFAGRPVPRPPHWLAGLLAQANRIYGQAAQEKIVALAGIAHDAPRGDVVEIGCLFGKSSYVLNRVAADAGLGATLCVDPWTLEHAVQHDAAPHLQASPRGWDWEAVHQGFLVNMLGCAAPPFNYIRAPSAQACRQYRTGQPVRSAEFGETYLAGAIAILHIDGNHDEAAVEQDFELWSGHVAPGGWIVFDDYHWPHGDGPRLVADRALAHFGANVVRHFVAGGAMFIKLREAG